MKASINTVILTLFLILQVASRSLCQNILFQNAHDEKTFMKQYLMYSNNAIELMDTGTLENRNHDLGNKALNLCLNSQFISPIQLKNPDKLYKTVLDKSFLEKEFYQQVWDGLDWVDSSRSLKTYDENFNNDTIIYQILNDTNWVNSKMTLNDYDASNNLIESIDQAWDGSNWVDSSKTLNSYNSNNNLIELLTQFWDGSVWVNSNKISNSYDSNNNLIEQLFQYWDISSGWENLLKTLNTYDVNNNHTEQLVQFWIISSWENYSLTINTYDVNNNRIESLSQLWDGSNWVNSSKTSNSYDSNNNLIEILSQIWDVSYWVNSNKISNSYDINNNLTESLSQFWNGSVWVNSRKTTNTYNSNYNLIETVDLIWDSTQSQWLNDMMRIYSYDSDDNVIEIIILEGDGTGWSNDLRWLYVWEKVIPVELLTFTYLIDENNVTLNWQTSTETNNAGFYINRHTLSENQWESIGFVEGKGTTTEPQFYSYVDEYLQAGTYRYRLKQVDLDGQYEYSDEIEVVVGLPLTFTLEQNYPNPFNPSTTINYDLPEANFVTIKVYDVLGKEVATLVNEQKPVGSYEVEFSAKGGYTSGVYFYKIQAGNFVETKKMMLMK